MSIAYFVADLPPDVAKRVCIVKEEITQTYSPGFGHGGSSHVPMFSSDRKLTRSLIRAKDVVMIFKLRSVSDVLAVLYEDQKHVRAISCDNEDGQCTHSNNDVFIDDKGFLRVIARLVVSKLNDLSSRTVVSDKGKEQAHKPADDNIDIVLNDAAASEEERPEPMEEENDDNVHDTVHDTERERDDDGDGTNDGLVNTQTVNTQHQRQTLNGGVKKPIRRNKPFVELNSKLTRIAQVYGSEQELVSGGGFHSYADALRIMENGGSRYKSWKECSQDIKSEFFKRGGRLPEDGRRNTSAKCVQQLDGSIDGRVIQTYACMTDAAIGAGAKAYDAYGKLKHAIERGESWKGCFWRFTPFNNNNNNGNNSGNDNGNDNGNLDS
jgi:hypothetical protein